MRILTPIFLICFSLAILQTPSPDLPGCRRFRRVHECMYSRTAGRLCRFPNSGLSLSKKLQGPRGDSGLPNFLSAEPRVTKHRSTDVRVGTSRAHMLNEDLDARREERTRRGGKRKRRGIKNISVSTYRSSQKLLSWEAALNAQLSAQQLTFAGPSERAGLLQGGAASARAGITVRQGRDVRRGLCE